MDASKNIVSVMYCPHLKTPETMQYWFDLIGYFDLWHISTGGCGSVQSAKVQYGSCFHRQKVGVTQTEPH